MKHIKIIFLDVDGVLNNIEDAKRQYKETGRPVIGYDWPFCDESLKTLKKIVKTLELRIVVSSSWRFSEEGIRILLNELEKYGIKEEIYILEANWKINKAESIDKYLEEKKEGEKISYVVLDDEDIEIKEKDKLYRTNPNIGLRERDFKGIMELFIKQEKDEL